MGQIETRGPQAPALLQHLLSNDVRRLPEGGAQYSVLCREDGGVLDDLFTYRLAECVLPDRHQRRQPRARPRVVPRHAPGFDVDVIDRLDEFAMLAVQGPDGPRRSSAGWPTASCRRACTASSARSRACPMLVCGTGYTGEDGRRAAARPRAAPARCGTRWWPRARRRSGSGARDTLRLEVCYHLYGNDLDRSSAGRSRPAWAGAARRRPASSASEAVAARARRRPGAEARGVRRSTAPGSPGRATRSRRRRGHQRDLLPVLWSAASAWRTFPAERAEPGTRIEIDVRGHVRAATVVETQAPLPQRSLYVADAELSGRSALPPRARLGPGRRRRGDVRHHLVRPGLAGRGRVLRPAQGRHAR